MQTKKKFKLKVQRKNAFLNPAFIRLINQPVDFFIKVFFYKYKDVTEEGATHGTPCISVQILYIK